jgi:hypothetical protein
MCCATANNPSKSTKDKESARSIVTAILLCLIGKKKNQISISSEMTKAMGMKENYDSLRNSFTTIYN